MSNYQAIVAQITHTAPIPGADNIHMATVLGETVIVSKAWTTGKVGLFFPAGTQLSEAYAKENNLHRDSSLNKDTDKKGFFESNRRVRAQPFLKVKSEGFFAELDSVAFVGDIGELKVGDRFEGLNGIQIATKYLNEKTRTAQANSKVSAKKKRAVPAFHEHVETEQFKHNIHKIHKGDLVSIQTKKHGTSARYGYHQVELVLPKWKQLVNQYIAPVFPTRAWQHVVGTRRVVLDSPEKMGFHGIEQYRYDYLEKLKPYLQKGMTVYGEIVGFANDKPIMATHSTSGLKDKAVAKKYGQTITYKYGCLEGTNKFHIYRITLANEDGQHIDFTQAQVVNWCAAHGFASSVDLVEPFVYNGNQEELLALVEGLTEREDVLTEDFEDPSHISEGVIVRVDRGTVTPLFLKSKSYRFRVLEGIAQELEVDLEDAS